MNAKSMSVTEKDLKRVKELIMLVDQMDKPKNFTYMDVLDLHSYLESLRDLIKSHLGN